MRNNVFVLLCSLDWKESFFEESLFFLDSLATFLGGKLAINTHQTCDSSNIFVLTSISVIESSQKIGDSSLVRLSSDIQKYDKFRLKKPTESLEKP